MISPTCSSLTALILAATAFAFGDTTNTRHGGGSDLEAARLMLTSVAGASQLPILDSGDWTSEFACVADIDGNQPSMIDENTCKTQKDANSQPCIWCDSSAITGVGVCVSQDLKEMAGQYWDSLCAAEAEVTTSAPTAKPTPAPTTPAPQPAPAPRPAPEPDNVGTDCSSTDEATCISSVDASSSTGDKCFWCGYPLIGGGKCLTNDMKAAVGFLCSSMGTKNGNLRGDSGGWNMFDPSCLGESSTFHAGGDEDSCGEQKDSSGNTCIWCDGAGVMGMCVSPSQKEYFSGYMDCGDSTELETGVFIAAE